MTELKPCPFCGGEASIYHGDSTDGYIKGTDYVLVFCGWCGASIREKKEDEVIKKWNNRTSPWHTGKPSKEGWYLIKFVMGKKGEEEVFYRTEKYKRSPYCTFDNMEWKKIEEKNNG